MSSQAVCNRNCMWRSLRNSLPYITTFVLQKWHVCRFLCQQFPICHRLCVIETAYVEIPMPCKRDLVSFHSRRKFHFVLFSSENIIFIFYIKIPFQRYIVLYTYLTHFFAEFRSKMQCVEMHCYYFSIASTIGDNRVFI